MFDRDFEPKCQEKILSVMFCQDFKARFCQDFEVILQEIFFQATVSDPIGIGSAQSSS